MVSRILSLQSGQIALSSAALTDLLGNHGCSLSHLLSRSEEPRRRCRPHLLSALRARLNLDILLIPNGPVVFPGVTGTIIVLENTYMIRSIHIE